jgi:hypothetical protein
MPAMRVPSPDEMEAPESPTAKLLRHHALGRSIGSSDSNEEDDFDFLDEDEQEVSHGLMQRCLFP